MAHDDILTVRHTVTGLVESLPRVVVEQVYPHLYHEVTELELVEAQREAEFEMYGEYKTPLPAQAASTPATEEEAD
jgi:hypothetical protein